jgi:hypothetical protein
MIPKSYTKDNTLHCRNCKYLIGGYYCFYGETEKAEDLLSNPKWQSNNEVYVNGFCNELIEYSLKDKN